MSPGPRPSSTCDASFSRGLTARVCVLAWLLYVVQPNRAIAQNRIEYRYEDYNEDGPRMHVRTHPGIAEGEFSSRVTGRVQFVYDAITGASPTGGYPAIDSGGKVPLNDVPINDI